MPMLVDKLAQFLAEDPLRIQALESVRSLALSDCYIAARFVRKIILG